ncbi:MAG: histidine phosphatase family protein [Candidatus Rokubacteria bacterium]|nr:histidine phosphatase family protein [Candidatus Rokubacteria bacterium]
MSKLRLYAIRHGETAWTRERRFAGARDIPLTEEGLRQCEAVAQALGGKPVAAVYTSPLERARASAEVIAKPHRLEVQIEAGFREMAFGEWEGRSRDEVARDFPQAYEHWRSAPERLALPGGERLTDVAARVNRALGALIDAHAGELVVLVSHAIVLRLIVLQALGLGPERLWTVDASPAGITEIEYEPGWATIHRMNTLSHLERAAP